MDDLATERLADGLMAKADAEDGQIIGGAEAIRSRIRMPASQRRACGPGDSNNGLRAQ